MNFSRRLITQLASRGDMRLAVAANASILRVRADSPCCVRRRAKGGGRGREGEGAGGCLVEEV